MGAGLGHALLLLARHEGPHQLDRKREDDRGVLLVRDLGQRLKVPKLQRRRLPAMTSAAMESRRRPGTPFRVNDLGASHSLGLLRHRPLHFDGIDLLDRQET